MAIQGLPFYKQVIVSLQQQGTNTKISAIYIQGPNYDVVLFRNKEEPFYHHHQHQMESMLRINYNKVLSTCKEDSSNDQVSFLLSFLPPSFTSAVPFSSSSFYGSGLVACYYMCLILQY